jgi:hypothetical protein
MDQINFQTKIRKGPREERECTDCWCAFTLALLLFGLFFLTVNKGSGLSAQRLGLPADTSGTVCGKDLAQDYPYLFFPETTGESVCVRACPLKDTGLAECLPNQQFRSCPPSKLSTPDSSGLCLPESNPQLRASVQGLIKAENDQELSVLPRSFLMIMGGVGIEALAGLLLAAAMLLLPTLALLAFYVAGMLLMGALAVLFLYEQVNGKLPFLGAEVKEEPGVYITLTIICLLLTLFMLAYLLLRCGQMHNLQVYLNNSAVFFRRNVTAVFFSLLVVGLTVAFFYGWALALVHLTLAQGSTSQTGFYPVAPGAYWAAYLAVLIPALVWGRGFLLSLSEFVVSAQTIFWYCQQKVYCGSLWAALGLALRYHVGSIAYAGITVANWPARLLTWSRRKAEALANE